MNELGIVSTTQNNRTSIHTLLCVSAWYINGQMVVNPYYVPMKNRFPEDNSTPVNAHVNTNGNTDDTAEAPAPSGQLATDVQDGNIPNQQQPSQQPSSQGQASIKVQEPTSNGTDQSDDQQPPAPQYHSIRDKVIDELNEMPK
jgi:hypothetical protein